MGIPERIGKIIESGNVANVGLQSRLVRYKNLEKGLSERFPNNVHGCDEYVSAADQVARAWVELVVDLATFVGEPMDSHAKEDILSTVMTSVQESVTGGDPYPDELYAGYDI